MSRKVSTVSMARAEYFRWRPGLPFYFGAHAPMASSENQNVMSPLALSALSYSLQLLTR